MPARGRAGVGPGDAQTRPAPGPGGGNAAAALLPCRGRVAFLGCPGVGKGTYASKLAQLASVPHISMGDVVRDELRAASALARKARPAAIAAAAPPPALTWPDLPGAAPALA
eukprot:SM000111S18836  [mRNA]  locus=s111:399260:399686:+ [translate_table: standard]